MRNQTVWTALCLPVVRATGLYGTPALEFNGTDQYVDIGPWPELSSEVMTQPVTFECWVNATTLSAPRTLLGVVYLDAVRLAAEFR